MSQLSFLTSKASFIESQTLTKTSTSTLSAGVCCITLLSLSLHTAEVTTKARDCCTCNVLGGEVQCPYTQLNCTIPPVNPISEPKVGHHQQDCQKVQKALYQILKE